MKAIDDETIKTFIECQLADWPLARQNYDALSKVKRRQISIGNYTCGMQYNPARIVSTGAEVSKEALQKRCCFLCRDNRPKEQAIFPILDDWEMLVNPYPIFPVHLTIASSRHVPQSHVPDDIVAVAERLPGMAVFYNGAKAGASAPDHLHLQAVLKDELPLLREVEKLHPESSDGLMSSLQLSDMFPFMFFSGVVAPDQAGASTLLAGLMLGGLSGDGKFTDPSLVNVFFWIGDGGKLRFISVPRRAHRSECYNAEGDANRMVSPGCIDMAGVIITPREIDFMKLDSCEVSKIYSDVAITI